ncbi:MAG: CHRD domain-containing protein [Ignavibacteria bacterium]
MKTANYFIISCLLAISLIFSTSNSKAEVFTIDITLTGLKEVPPNPSTATGVLFGTYDDVTNVLDFDLIFNGLSAPTTAGHFHGPAPAGVIAPVQIGFAGFPVGVTSGSYSNTYVLTPAQELQILGGLWYVNIHTSLFPGGEIRGQLEEGTLPVELSSFTSTVNQNKVELNWSTATEVNNSGFEIERKNSSSNEWIKAGFVAGNGNSIGTKNFSYTDRVNTGIYNYRLKQIDYNGVYEYFNLSNEVIVGVPSVFNISQNYPNPFNPTTSINYEIPNEAVVSIQLFDMSGRVVSSLVNERQSAGFYTIQLNASDLPSGTYFYKMSAQGENANFTSTRKMTLIK